MIPRILEVEAMDTPEEAADYDSMDHAAVNEQFTADFLLVYQGHGPVLDVGTGTARIPILVCQRKPHMQVVGIDLAGHMLELGRRNVQQANLADRIELQQVNARGMPFRDGQFSAVISNSIIHHIPEPQQCIAEMVRVCAPGGVLFVRDLLRPNSEAELLNLVHLHAAGANEHQRKLFADSLHAALTLAEIQALIVEQGFPAASVQQTSDRHWTWIGHRPL